MHCEIALNWLPHDLTSGKSTLVQVMACCCQATRHCLIQYWPRATHYGIRPQWVKQHITFLPVSTNYPLPSFTVDPLTQITLIYGLQILQQITHQEDLKTAQLSAASDHCCTLMPCINNLYLLTHVGCPKDPVSTKIRDATCQWQCSKLSRKSCQSFCLESQIINIKLRKIFQKVPSPPPKLSASGRRTGSNLEHCQWCVLLTHYGLVMSYGDTELGQYWFEKWLVTWLHQANTCANKLCP